MLRQLAWMVPVTLVAVLTACADTPTDDGEQLSPRQAQAAVSRQPVCPAGWSTRSTGKGIVLCSRSYTRRRKTVTDFLQVLDLQRGASIANVYQAQAAATTSKPSPRFTKRTVADWWSRTGGRRFCTVNGAFFESSTELSFPLRVGSLVTAGAEIRADRPRMVLVLGSTQATMQAYTATKKDYATVSKAMPGGTSIVGYYWHFGKEETGAHTFIAIKDADANGSTETVLVYSTLEGTPNEIGGILANEIRVRNIIQFDGGGSAQLECGGSWSMNRNSRAVPHAFGTFAAAN